MSASDTDAVLAIFTPAQWDALIAELGRRGAPDSEAGAFLLADRAGDRRIIAQIVYFDDLDPNCLQGHIHFDGRAYSLLWDICDAEGLLVVGDIHTHPQTWVEQSPVDAENPMVALPGHVAIIVPDLGVRPVDPSEAGVHEYRGEEGWRSWTGAQAAERLLLRTAP